MPAIRVDGLQKRYGHGAKAVEALRGVNLTVERGEIYGLLGRNGAGKTTLVKILLDIVRPTAGAAALLDQPCHIPVARKEVGYLPEDHRLPDYRTGEGLLHFYAELSDCARDVRLSRVPELLRLVGLHEAAQRKVRTYSKGMKQRLGLAQALIHDPQVVLLDEPTDGVDPVGRAEIRRVLEQLKQQGRTIFVNSHLISEVERVCDRVGILEKGVLVRQGAVEELTRTECVFTITTVPAPPETVRTELRQLAEVVNDVAGGLEVTLRREEDVDRVVDLLRRSGLSVRGLVEKRLTLEEVFLSTIGAQPAPEQNNRRGVAP